MKKPLVVILAGGEGKRFSPLVTHKTLFPFMGKPLIAYVFEMLLVNGLDRICMVTSGQNDEEVMRQAKGFASVKTYIQKTPLGMADAVLGLEKELRDEPVLIINGVDLVDPSYLSNFLKKAQNSYALVAGRRSAGYFPGGYLEVEGERLRAIIEKPDPKNVPSDIVSLVFDYFRYPQEFISLLKKSKTTRDDRFEQALNALSKEKEVSFLPYEGEWVTLKYPFHVLDVVRFLLPRLKTRVSPGAEVSNNAVLTGDVYIEEGAKIHDGAVIRGPAYVGKNAVVGTNALVRESLIEEGAVVGFGTEVARSYVGPRCQLHHNFIGDSVLESDVNPSYGTCTANLRIDGSEVDFKVGKLRIPTGKHKLGAVIGRGAFFGVQCTTLPGISIGTDVKIYPGSLVHESLPAGSILKTYQKQSVIEEKMT